MGSIWRQVLNIAAIIGVHKTSIVWHHDIDN